MLLYEVREKKIARIEKILWPRNRCNPLPCRFPRQKSCNQIISCLCRRFDKKKQAPIQHDLILIHQNNNQLCIPSFLVIGYDLLTFETKIILQFCSSVLRNPPSRFKNNLINFAIMDIYNGFTDTPFMQENVTLC